MGTRAGGADVISETCDGNGLCRAPGYPGNPPARTREPDDGARRISSPFTGFFVCKTTMREGLASVGLPKFILGLVSSCVPSTLLFFFFDPPGGCAWCWEERVCVSVLCVCGRDRALLDPVRGEAFRLTCSACQSARGRAGKARRHV